MLKAVFFDLDGTLADTSGDLGSALNRLLLEENIPPIAANELRAQVSNGANALIRLGFGDALSPEVFEQYRERLLAHYLHNICEHTRLFAGIDTLIEQLHAAGLSWGIVTNKPKRYTEVLVPLLGFPVPPVAVICPEDTNSAKPAPDGLLLACRLSQCTPQQAAYVGDHLRDIDCGRNAGAVTIAVGYGFTETPNEYLQWQADFTASKVEDLWPTLMALLRHPLG